MEEDPYLPWRGAVSGKPGCGEKLSEMALGWLLAQQEVTSVLIGASRPQQILDNIKAIHCAPFTEEEIVRIDEIAAEKIQPV